jgi:Protein of unknown function (DUF3017)
MANRPANAGSDRGLAGAPPPVHHQGPARRPGPPPGHRARPRDARAATDARDARDARDVAGEPNAPASSPLAWLPYLIVLGGVAVGLFVTWQGAKYAGLGTSLVGGALLAAAAARLLLPPRYAELLSSRWKASDVVAFAVLGVGVLAIALVLP